MCVIGATVFGRLLGPLLLACTSGDLHGVLSREMPVTLSGDYFLAGVFDARLLDRLNRLLVFIMPGLNHSRMAMVVISVNRLESIVIRNILLPERFWSGCPPK